MSRADYVLGADAAEIARLEFQQEVWGPVTERFLDRLGVADGWACLDAGCGPGFVLESLARRVGPRGRAVGIDQSEVMVAHARTRVRGLDGVSVIAGSLESFAPQERSFDLVFLRWVLSFPADPERVVHQLARSLKPGGWLAIQDYNHHGISLFPESKAFLAVIEATRALYRRSGGDAFIAGRLPGILRRAGLELIELTPNVLAGGPQSGVFRWAGRFFPPFSARMVEENLLTSEEREQFLADWEARSRDPEALFFSPIVCDVAARARP